MADFLQQLAEQKRKVDFNTYDMTMPWGQVSGMINHHLEGSGDGSLIRFICS